MLCDGSVYSLPAGFAGACSGLLWRLQSFFLLARVRCAAAMTAGLARQTSRALTSSPACRWLCLMKRGGRRRDCHRSPLNAACVVGCHACFQPGSVLEAM
jgi:hypothetical protein